MNVESVLAEIAETDGADARIELWDKSGHKQYESNAGYGVPGPLVLRKVLDYAPQWRGWWIFKRKVWVLYIG